MFKIVIVIIIIITIKNKEKEKKVICLYLRNTTLTDPKAASLFPARTV